MTAPDLFETIFKIATMAIDNDSMREQIMDELSLSDEDVIEIYKYLETV